jgi:outer membrane protein assembly factor BamA
MTSLIEQLQLLRQDDVDVASVLDAFEEVDRVYQSALEAMGVVNPKTEVVMNSATVTITFQPGESAHSLMIVG